jgi:phage shock protein PspC (stress-responsive transcriptional regulator)
VKIIALIIVCTTLVAIVAYLVMIILLEDELKY